ncbi:MAG: divalent-cation tolerance protein CutA [Prochlorococcaceae cyanobacterium]
MPRDAELVLVLTTEADQERAEALARALLERRLAACVSLQPLLSLYHWQGRLERGTEVQLLIKTLAHRLGALEEAVRDLHSYSTPEWIHWPARCSAGYGAWLLESGSSAS